MLCSQALGQSGQPAIGGRRHVTKIKGALWGVGNEAAFGHDGRSINLTEIILRHGGEAQAAASKFAQLGDGAQAQIESFLMRLVLFPPDDSASNLDPGDPSAPDFPQQGHGACR